MDVAKQANERRIAIRRQALVILWLVAATTALILASGAIAETQGGWQFNEAARTLQTVSYETMTAVFGGVRLALTGLMLATAALLLSRREHGAQLAALALMTLPFTFNLGGKGTATALPAPWPTLLDAVAVGLGVVGIAALLLLLFLFPDDRFFPPRLRIPALIGLGLVIAGFVFLQFVGDAWLVVMLVLAATVLLGLVGQVQRYRAAGAAARRQTIGFLAAPLALPVFVVLSATGFSAVLSLAAGYALLTLLPLGLLLGVARGLWGSAPAKGTIRLFAGAVVALGIATSLTAFLWWTANRPAKVDANALAATESIPVVLDADMAMDDLSALLFLWQHPAVDLRAITVNGVAFAHCQGGVRAALGLLEVAHAPEVPVACGREEAFPGGHPAPDAWRKSADSLYGAQVRLGNREADPRPAARLLADTIAAAPGEIIVVALGPLTNLAEAFQADPALAIQIKRIVIMGGALDVPGNVANEDEGITNAFAEWNFFADPVAADIVLASGAAITLVPLDATNDVPFTRSFYQRLQAHHLTRPATFTYNLLYLNPWWLDGGMYWWDTLAAATATDRNLVSVQTMALDVVTEPGPSMGRVVPSSTGPAIEVAINADQRAFEALFLAVLNHE